MSDQKSKISIPQEELDRARQKLEDRIKSESIGFDRLFDFLKNKSQEEKN